MADEPSDSSLSDGGPSDSGLTESRVLATPLLRYAVLAFGWIMFAIGIISVPVPLFPSSIFLLAALWAFSISSPRIRRWILGQRWLGAALRALRRHPEYLHYGTVLGLAIMAASLSVIAVVVVLY